MIYTISLTAICRKCRHKLRDLIQTADVDNLQDQLKEIAIQVTYISLRLCPVSMECGDTPFSRFFSDLPRRSSCENSNISTFYHITAIYKIPIFEHSKPVTKSLLKSGISAGASVLVVFHFTWCLYIILYLLHR